MASAIWDRLHSHGLIVLHGAGQSWWQALPLGPTGYGNSPYQSLSSFAGNALVVSPDSLISDRLLEARDCQADFSGWIERVVNYDSVIPFKHAAASKGVGELQGRTER